MWQVQYSYLEVIVFAYHFTSQGPLLVLKIKKSLICTALYEFRWFVGTVMCTLLSRKSMDTRVCSKVTAIFYSGYVLCKRVSKADNVFSLTLLR